ncbi:hypothetical protein VA596_25620 [Amycolatopsis sp., V23-08]|uniref:ABC transporter permease n=1 Tax=Amycolatopsis heterodermiae TaxID=3110235 RepID=A0ABU5RBB3_9PSEU|nr:hypothetical protein [Amycolatopsis sp., V23-08]MEA5362934.1 hypothetical protein [Amycolatopsis sp., V23-08]
MGAQVPTRGEVAQAAVWLGRHGVRVRVPTRLLATRLGMRVGARPLAVLGRLAVFYLAGTAGALGYQSLQYLPGVRGVEMTDSKVAYFLLFAIQGAIWSALRQRDRKAAAALGQRALDRPRPPWRALRSGWYFASVVVTFAGGAALGATMFFTTEYRTYAWSWLGLLAMSAVVFGAAFAGVVRRPVIAEDEPSLAVDAVLRIEDLSLTLPAIYASPVLTDLVTTHRQPPGFAPWLAGYAALAIALQVVDAIIHGRRRPALPDGNYGVPSADPQFAQTAVNWSPPEAPR